MATREVKEREAGGEDLTGLAWTPEKPYMLIRLSEGNMMVSFFCTEDDFNYALKKADKNGDEIIYAAKVEAFRKIGPYKSGFGRKEEVELRWED